MRSVKKYCVLTLLLIGGCDQSTTSHNRAEPPTQVVYRFDDHRYLELTGFDCEGGLTYIDTKRNIRHQIYDISDGYRIFTKKFIHPSERYIVIPEFEDANTFAISKDYGTTWSGARMTPGGGADRFGERIPERTYNGIQYAAGEWTHPVWDDVVSLTVVNDQGFLMNKWGDLYMSSKPFDDPRMMPGGSGIDYTLDGEKHHLRPRYNGTSDNSYWGKNYTSWASVQGGRPWSTSAYETNWQNIPNKVPEVKNYTGWDHMQCNPDLGLPESEQGK